MTNTREISVSPTFHCFNSSYAFMFFYKIPIHFQTLSEFTRRISVTGRMPTETSCYQSLRAASCNIGELRVVFCRRTKQGYLSLKSPKPTTVDTKGSQSALLASQIYSLQLLSLTTARCLGLETTWYRKENTDKAKPIPGWDLESPQILLGIDICVSFFHASFPNDVSFSKFVAGKCCKVSWNFANLN